MTTTAAPHRAGLAALLALALVAGLPACGDDGGSPDAAVDAPTDVAVDAPPVASDYAGLWLMTSLTLATPGGPVTVVRDGTPQGVSGDALFVATGAVTATLRVRQVLLASGLLASDLQAFDAPLVVEPDRFVLTEQGGDILVFRTALTGDHLVLTPDPSDPRHTASDPPDEVVLDRVTPWSTRAVGDWDLVSMTTPEGTITAGVCTQAGSQWLMVTMDITFSDRLLFERVMTLRAFSDDACTTQTASEASTQVGYAEEEGGVTLRLWGDDGEEAEYLVFSMAQTGDTLTLTRTACLPTPGCEDTAPTTVVVQRP
mgnify:CR=1 FL=1